MQENMFITVPETALPDGSTVPAFEVGQYLCSRSSDGKLAVTAEGSPWVQITYAAAVEACRAAGFALLTERQWLAIAHNVASLACNWNTGIPGKGRLFQGLRNDSVTEAQPGTFEPEDPDEQRWLTLTNGARICDINGNVLQWIHDDVQGDADGLVARPFAADSLSLQAPYPSMEKGMGWRPEAGTDWSGNALLRGGRWFSGRHAGAFRLSGGWPGDGWDLFGFRCTR